MEDTAHRAIAIVGVGAILPDAPNAAAFWDNIKSGRYCISEVPPERWNPDFYYDEDRTAPDKTYSKIGGWVREFPWEPMKWRMPIPPLVAKAMDEAQQWGLACTREALEDYGFPKRPLDMDRTAVILGNAMAGEKHYLTALRVYCPEYELELKHSESFASLPEKLRTDILRELRACIGKRLPEITEDSMPGELANCLAGRIANIYNFHGPNFTSDAACASTMAAMTAAINGLIQKDFDAVIAGGIDRNMGAPTFVKFCKIGALSATGTRPFAEGADGFVMGEGAAIFILKRLEDAERNGDKIYAVIRGIGAASDGKGKGITAPNPIGQEYAIERAWKAAGLSPATVTMMEAHGTSTKVGDLVEFESMMKSLENLNLPAGSIALGSVKSNIGHLKGAAAAAGLLKTTLSLHEKVLPPSVNCPHTNPGIDFAHSPLFVNTELRPWEAPKNDVRRAGLSAFGFGGTNFHMVVEEYVPGRLNGNGKHHVAVSNIPSMTGGVPVANAGADIANASANTQPIAQAEAPIVPQAAEPAPVPAVAVEAAPKAEEQATAPKPASRKTPLRGALVIGAETPAALADRLKAAYEAAVAGNAPAPAAPDVADLLAPERIAIDYGDSAELADKAGKALKAIKANIPAMWKALRAQGIFRGQGPAPKVAFLYTGQGSQYVNMMKDLRAIEPVVEQTFAEADEVLTPLLGKPLSKFIFIDGDDPKAVEKAENDLRQTAITQPAVIATDVAMTRLLEAYGIKPDMAMGHSVGEYGALVATGGLPFHDSMEAVSARGREMTKVSLGDNGGMAAVFAPLAEIERILKTIDGYVVIANINSKSQAVIGGESKAMQAAVEAFLAAGYNAVPLPVSHAFHTSIVAAASEPLKRMLERLRLTTPKLLTVSNVTGEFYPMNTEGKAQMVEVLSKQVAAPVQFVKGLETLYNAGARVFVETGPKKALHGFAEDVLGERGDVLALFTNHPKLADDVAFNQALCGLYASGLGAGESEPERAPVQVEKPEAAPTAAEVQPESEPVAVVASAKEEPAASTPAEPEPPVEKAPEHIDEPALLTDDSIVITGASLGLPGTERVFDDSNVRRILSGEQFIKPIPTALRNAMLDKHVTRLVKSENGGAFETINSVDDVIKLAGRGGAFDVVSEFGVSTDRAAALDTTTAMAIAVGIDALRDAGIPLVMRYKTTSKGTKLFDRWMLPEALRDDTGVIFASAFPSYGSFADDMALFHQDRARREQVKLLQALHARAIQTNGHSPLGEEIAKVLADTEAEIEAHPFLFNRRFLFRVLSMGHSQFAEFIGARGPNTQINAACASTSQAISIAEDWIKAGRCRRVIVVSADDVTSDSLFPWLGTGFLASGAAATDENVDEAVLPFDRRRHGLVVGMGAAALVVERADAVKERGLQPICEILGSATANSAFHGTRLDVQHICGVMEGLVAKVEAAKKISRHQAAHDMMFMSHETYTPARGGSASAEIHALRHVFGDKADDIVIANTKGFTGHAMATGIEDVVAVKALETGIVPPIPNFKEIDPELGSLHLSKGGDYPVTYALRLAAGFGSQISMLLLRWIETRDGKRATPDALGYKYRIINPEAWNKWLSKVSDNPAPELEVVQRTLRVHDPRVPVKTPEPVQEAQPAPVAQAEPAPALAKAAAASAATAPEPAVVAQAAAVVAEPVVVLEPPMAPEPVVQPIAKETVPEPDVTSVSAEPEVIEVEPVSAVFAAPETPAVVEAEDRTKDSVAQRILQLVAEKTGYPIEMLDLDLDLEADLGVDTVKQAEVFATIREAYGIPRDDSIKLRDYPTLSHVIRFVHERCPQVGAPSPTANATETIMSDLNSNAAVKPAFAPTGASVEETILAMVVEKTGYPKEMLDLELDLEADLGIDTVKQAELFVAVRTVFDIPRDENLKLRDYNTLAKVIQFVRDKKPDLAGGQPAAESVKTEAAPVAAPVAASVSTALITEEEIKAKVLEIVAEKTGYPKDMLDLDLDLEADLGVDTVKQAEMFAAVRAAYNIPRDENIKLHDFPTLAHVIKFAYQRQPGLAAAAPAPAPIVEAPKVEAAALPVEAPKVEPAITPAAALITEEEIKAKVLEIVAEKTGYPKDMLDLDLDLEADLGVDTVKQAEMFAAVRAAYNIPRDENIKLHDFPTLAHVIKFAFQRQPGAVIAAPAPAPVVEAPKPEAAPEPTPAAPAPVTTSAAAIISEEEIKAKVLAIVAEKTGYPKDMLDLDLDLEADLGVDTVKQAEMFAAVRAAYNIPRDENIKLHDFPTLAHVIKFAYQRQPGVAAAAPVPAAPIIETPRVEAPAPVVEAPKAEAQASPAAPLITEEEIKAKVLAIVAEKTGYPKNMLDLDLDLEADLGVDTVKQAEMFAAVRAAYNIPRDENIKLHDFPTLAHVIKFAYQRQPGLAAPAAAPAVQAVPAPEVKPAAPKPAPRPRPPVASLDAANSIPRRVPVPILRPALELCKPSAVKLGPGSRVVLMPDKGGVAEALTQQLQKLGVEVLRIEGTPDADTLNNTLKTWMAAGPIQGVYWLPALNHEVSFRVMDLPGWREALRVRVKLLYHTMRTLYEQVVTPNTFLVSATLLGGQHGYDEAGAIAPLGGAVVGMTKTYKRERPDVQVKCVDFELGREAPSMAQTLLDETLRDPGAVEVGYKETERWTVALQEQPAIDGQPGMVLNENTVFVVTGAAGGITSAITADLAAASGGTFYLLDLVPEPDPNNPELKLFATDKDTLKRQIFARIQASGVRATPALVEKEIAGLERAQAALNAINAVKNAGGTANYFSVNLTNAESVAGVMEQIRQRSGRIDVLLHAAGMERSHFLPDKDPKEFDLVFDVKSDGWFNLLRNIGEMPLGATVAFSSIAGRFGNGGQADYSSANDLLCKITSSFRTTRPGTRGIVIDWTAWGGIGMATRGSIPKMMEIAGIDMLPPEAGVPTIRRELTSGGTRGEVLVAQRLGILQHEFDVTGGIDPEAASKLVPKFGPMIGKITNMGIHNGLTIETTLDPTQQPFLHDHQIGGTPVLPGVMGIESFAETALALLPGWHIEAIEDVEFMAPFKFYRNQPRTLNIEAVISQHGDNVIAECKLIGSRLLPKSPEPEVTTHFKGRVILTKQAPAKADAKQAAAKTGALIKAADIYRIYFHGPAYKVMQQAWQEPTRIIGELAANLPPNNVPAERLTVQSPRMIEFCFQTAGLWEISVNGRMGLPLHVERLSIQRSIESATGPLYAVVTPDSAKGTFDVEVVDGAGNLYMEMVGYKTVALPESVSPELLAALHAHA